MREMTERANGYASARRLLATSKGEYEKAMSKELVHLRDEYRKAGEPVDSRERAALTDEMLLVVRALLAGETVTHRGQALVVDDVTLAPLPVQARIPVWVGGGSRGARRRAARVDRGDVHHRQAWRLCRRGG